MSARDSLGYRLAGANADGVEHFERALRMFQCYTGDPLAQVDAALAACPGMPMAHALRAWLHLLGTEPAALPVAREAHRAALRLLPDAREAGHLRAIGLVLDGRWHDAGRVLEDVAIQWPLDALALQAGHSIDFFTGSSRMLRDRIARALPLWDPAMPGYHALLGMHAFGLEETADYERAEAQGRYALALEPRDCWAKHAVAHVMEMQGRRHDGIAWLRSGRESWSEDSYFAVHNWWHLALFHLGLDEIAEVFALLDGPIDGKRCTLALEMIDLSALLWRLHLRGVDTGNRWRALAERWMPLATAGNYAFNDVHAVMAFVGAGDVEAVDAVLQAQREAIARHDDNALFTRDVGHPMALALKAFGRGDFRDCTRLLRDVRPRAQRFGGSHAQRDLLDLTLIEAARRDGDEALAHALAAERLASRAAPHRAVAPVRAFHAA
jgi:hypothetical protein